MSDLTTPPIGSIGWIDLTVENAEGRRVLYQEDADGDHGYCQVCEEVDSHKAGCAVGIAERVLRHVQSMPESET